MLKEQHQQLKLYSQDPQYPPPCSALLRSFGNINRILERHTPPYYARTLPYSLRAQNDFGLTRGDDTPHTIICVLCR